MAHQLSEKPLPPLPLPSPPSPQHRQLPDTNLSSSPTHPAHRRTASGAPRPADQSSNSNITEFEFVDGSQLQVDSSDSDDFRPSTNRRRPAQHGRSMSHPFPSLFSGKRKKKASRAGAGGTRGLDGNDSEEDSDDLAPAKQTHQRHGQSAGSRDYTTGDCMTCGYTSRWLTGATVFRCTVCATINDLQPTNLRPINLGTRPSGDFRLERQGSDNDQGSAPVAVQPVSVEHTKLLVRTCLRNFVALSLLPRPGAGGSQPAQGLVPRPTDNGGPDAQGQDGHGRHPSSNLSTPRLVESPLEERDPFDSVARHRPPRSYSSSYPDQRPVVQADARGRSSPASFPMPPDPDPRRIFKPLEDYLVTCFTSSRCLNMSFGGPRPSRVEEARRRFRTQDAQSHRGGGPSQADCPIAELDPKLLLLGDVAENGTWWAGGQDGALAGRARPGSSAGRSDDAPPVPPAAPRSLNIEWAELEEWYTTIINAGQPWKAVYDDMVTAGTLPPATDTALRRLDTQVLVAQDHVQGLLLQASEMVLRRPGRPVREPADLRFALIILANPLLSARYRTFKGHYSQRTNARGGGPASGQHSGIIKRVVGMMTNSPNECHTQLVNWLARYPENRLIEAKDIMNAFLAYRLVQQKENGQEFEVDVTGGLIPNVSVSRSVAALHAALEQSSSRQTRRGKEAEHRVVVNDDWQIKAAARAMSFIFTANNVRPPPRGSRGPHHGGAEPRRARGMVLARGQLLPTSDFYMTQLDDSDLAMDFETWESRRGKFSFCQYPFLLSMWAKMEILEYDTRRQMDKRTRDAFFDTIMGNGIFEQYLHLSVRRHCLVEDSLRAVSGVIGSGSGDIKKAIRIAFRGEEGIDAGGLRKEWFLLLVREVFNPDHGLFIYDEDSRYCYFNPFSLETSDQYFLVGVVLGLAIYNSNILDIALPPFAYRKLLAAAPISSKSPQQHRPTMNYTLDDLAEFRPRLARGLRQLLEYEGDVESTFCQDFVIELEKYGSIEKVPLTPGGEKKPVTNSNRREYVDLYVQYLLDKAVFRQFDPFKRGFFTVCNGNALSLFRPEEIELLIRGSDEPLDVSSMRTAADYEGWGSTDPEDTEDAVRWFWELLEEASPSEQRKMLVFITGSDRIPATGITALTIRLLCGGGDCERYPSARTCFNHLTIYRYASKKKMARLLWDAVHGSEGFGLK